MNSITFKGSRISLEGHFLKAGEKAPEFDLVTQDLKDYHLKELKKVSFLYVAPSLDTGVCLLSTKKINDMCSLYPQVDFFIISADLPFAQKRICGLEHIENIKSLSMMRDKKFAKDYGLLINEGPLKGLCARAIYIIDQAHKILYSQLVEEVTHEPDYDKAFSSLKKLLP